MKWKNLNLSRHVVLTLAFLTCLAVGLKTLVLNTISPSEAPQLWELSLPESLALIVVGVGLSATLLGHSRARRLSGWLCIGYGISSALFFLNAFEFNPFEFPEGRSVGFAPSILIIYLGMCVVSGVKARARYMWRIAGWSAVFLGSISLLNGLIGIENLFVTRIVLGDMSLTAEVFAIALGLSVLLMTAKGWRIQATMSSRSVLIAAGGVAVTLVLVHMASVDRYREQQLAAHDLLNSLGKTIQQSTRHRSHMLQRTIERWARLGDSVGDDFYRTEMKSLMEDRPALRGFLLVDPGRTTNWRYAASPSVLFWMEDQLVSNDVLRWLRELREGQQSRSWHYTETGVADRFLVGVRPSGDRDKVLVAVLDLGVLLKKELRKDSGQFQVSITRGDQILTTLGHIPPNLQPSASKVESRSTQILPDGPVLTLEGRSASFSMISQFHAWLPLGILIFGLFLTYQVLMSRTLMGVQAAQARRLASNEQRFRSLFDQNPVPILCFDGAGRLASMNSAARAQFDVLGREIGKTKFHHLFNSDTVPAGDLKAVYGAYDHASQGGVKADFSFSFGVDRPSLRIFEAAFLPVRVGDMTDGVFCVAKDLTHRLRVEEKQRIMQRSLEASSNGIVITDARAPGYPVVYVNPAFTRITGYSSDEVRDQTLDLMVGEDTAREDVEAIIEAVRNSKPANLTIRSYRKDGTPFWNQLFVSPVRNESNVVTHFIGVMNDISEKKEYDQKLAYQATHDVLTGLGNRSLFADRLAHDFELARRDDRLLAVLFIDLDEFKPINDALGHKVGDQLLISIARRLQGIIRGSDTLARFGGDEFVLLLPALETMHEAEEVARRVLEEIAKPHVIQNHELHISASIGVAVITEELAHHEKLLQQADMAMYRAKEQGRDTYEIYSRDLDQRLVKRLTLRNDLQEAINQKQLYIEYQPLVDRRGEPCNVEALVRWRHPEKGNISPADFIPLAEETGQIIQLGRWVTKQACRDARVLSSRGLLSGHMAVNLSPMQFHRPNFLPLLRQVLEETGLAPSFLELELTEGILMKDTEGAIDILNALSGMGISTAIDDFGTGFSSFSYLRELPVNKVKIDQSFVRDVLTSEKDASVCKGIISLAKELGLKVVAEGVETEEQFASLKGNGCEVFQGYLFARPMRFDSLVEWMEARVPVQETY